jgi:hypothetical protein
MRMVISTHSRQTAQLTTMKKQHWHICLDHLDKSTIGGDSPQAGTPCAALRHQHTVHETHTHGPHCEGGDKNLSPTQITPSVRMSCTQIIHGNLSSMPQDSWVGIFYQASRAVCTPSPPQGDQPSSHLTTWTNKDTFQGEHQPLFLVLPALSEVLSHFSLSLAFLCSCLNHIKA